MTKIIKTILIMFLTVFLFDGTALECFADQNKVVQIEQKRERAKKEIKKLKLLEKIEVGKLYNNQRQLEKTENSLSANKIKYESAKKELDRLNAQLEVQLADYRKIERETSLRIIQIHKTKRSGYIDFLLNAGNLNDFLDRIYFENLIMSIDNKNMINAKTKAASIQNLREKVEKQKIYLANSIKTMDMQQKNIQSAINRNEKMIYKLKNDRAAWEKSERELAKQSEQLSRFITKTVSKTSGTTTIKTTGNFLRPVSGPVTSPFGTRIHPIFKRKITHTGVDLGMPMGAKVKAANSGKVIYVGWYGGYGKVVIIDHGRVNGVPVTTLYAHLSSYNVANGSSVYKGQIIANVGSTGYSTGPHLHFEVRENGKPVNPGKYAPI